MSLFFHKKAGEESREDLSSLEVSKVDAVLSSIQNDEVSQFGNSAVESQGRLLLCYFS